MPVSLAFLRVAFFNAAAFSSATFLTLAKDRFSASASFLACILLALTAAVLVGVRELEEPGCLVEDFKFALLSKALPPVLVVSTFFGVRAASRSFFLTLFCIAFPIFVKRPAFPLTLISSAMAMVP